MEHKDMMQLLDKVYAQSICGVDRVSLSVQGLAEDYLAKHPDREKAIKAFIYNQIVKCCTSGFLAGVGGALTLPVAIPANIGSVLYVQMRMIAGLAYMGGYDPRTDQVQTLVYACLAGIAVDQVIKNAGIKVGVKMGEAMVRRIPGSVLTKINQKVGFRMLTKFGSKGIINLGKAVPLVGGIIGGGFDGAETKIIAARASKMFIQGDLTACDDGTEE